MLFYAQRVMWWNKCKRTGSESGLRTACTLFTHSIGKLLLHNSSNDILNNETVKAAAKVATHVLLG